MNIILAVLSSSLKGQKYAVPEGRTRRIGRGSGADIVIFDTMSSRVHCEIANQGHQIVLTDLKSSNGTFVNETAVKTAKLYSGDRIRVGSTVFEVRGVEGRPKDDVEEEPLVVVEKHGKTRMVTPSSGKTRSQAPQSPVAPADKPVPDTVPTPSKISLAEFESLLAGAAAESSGHELVSGAEQGILGRHPLAQDSEPTQVFELGKLKRSASPETAAKVPAKAETELPKPVEPPAGEDDAGPADTRVSPPPVVTKEPAKDETVLSVWEPVMKKAKPSVEPAPEGESPSEIIFDIPERSAEERAARASAGQGKLPAGVLEAVPGYGYEGELPRCISCGRAIGYRDIESGSARKLAGGYECPRCAGTRLKTPEGAVLDFTEMQRLDVAVLDEKLLQEMEAEEAGSGQAPLPPDGRPSGAEPG